MPVKERAKVVFFLPTLEAGGTERNVVNLVNAIDRQIYQVSVVLGQAKGDFMKDIAKDIAIIDLAAPRSLGLFFALVRYFKTQKPDIIVSAFPRINIICIAAKMSVAAATSIIITEHSVFSMLGVIAKTPFRRFVARFFMPALARFFYPKADAIVCVSKGIADDLAKIISVPQKTSVIFNPVIDGRVYALAKESAGHLWFADTSIPIIIAAGRLVKVKDYPTMLRAFKKVLENRVARLVILGAGPELAALQALSAQLGISERVAFLGFVTNPFKYMAHANVFVLSSLQEGFGNVIIEAMACGLPVMATDCPTGPGEIITDGENGILVRVGDEIGLARGIMKILGDDSLAKKYAGAGKKRAEFFSVEKSVAQYQHLFKAL